MRLRTTLLHVAVLLTTGCGSSGQIASTGGTDGGTDTGAGVDAAKDALPEQPEAACGGCNCGQPNVQSGSVSPQQACALEQSFFGGAAGGSSACNAFCEGLNDGGAAGYVCTLPTDYVTAYQAAVGDGGTEADAGADAGPICPVWTANVLVGCGFECLGRRTEGIEDCLRSRAPTLGEVFAGRAYLEEVSVHAFARLERELAAHGAPTELLREARRARRDEVRHTAMMTRLARRFGRSVSPPRPPVATPVRSLFEIALENAVEGCVRETYGAVTGLVEARRSIDADVRRAMDRIGADECRHAELAWAVARWIMPRLTQAEQQAVRCAARAAIESLAAEGDRRIVSMLDRLVWRAAA